MLTEWTTEWSILPRDFFVKTFIWRVRRDDRSEAGSGGKEECRTVGQEGGEGRVQILLTGSLDLLTLQDNLTPTPVLSLPGFLSPLVSVW